MQDDLVPSSEPALETGQWQEDRVPSSQPALETGQDRLFLSCFY